MLMRVFVGWLRGERGHCSMVAVPSMEEEDARRPNRERENLVGERTRIINRMKGARRALRVAPGGSAPPFPSVARRGRGVARSGRKSRFSAEPKSWQGIKKCLDRKSPIQVLACKHLTAKTGSVLGRNQSDRSCRQLLTACPFKVRQVLAHKLPEDWCCNFFIAVAENVADAGDFGPRDIRVTRLHLWRQMPAGLGNDLNATLHEPMPLPVGLKGIEREIAQHRLDAPRRFYHVVEPQGNGTLRH
jgi:hypothetical protein